MAAVAQQEVWDRYGDNVYGTSQKSFFLPEASFWMPKNALKAFRTEGNGDGYKGMGSKWLETEYADEHAMVVDVLAAKKILEESVVQESKEILQLNEVEEGITFVETFSGQAPISTSLLKELPGITYRAYDIDGRNEEEMDARIEFKEHNILMDRLDLEDETVDLIVDLNGLYTVTIGAENISTRQVEERYRRVIEEYDRVLKNGGRIIINGPFESSPLSNPINAFRHFLIKENDARRKMNKPSLKLDDFFGDVGKVLKRNANLINQCRFIPQNTLIQMIEESGNLKCEKIRTGSYYGANTYMQIVKE